MKKCLLILFVVGCALTSSAQDLSTMYQDPLFEKYIRITDELIKLGYSPSKDTAEAKSIVEIDYQNALNEMQTATSFAGANAIMISYNIPNANQITLKLQELQANMGVIATTFPSLLNLTQSDFNTVWSNNISSFKQARTSLNINSLLINKFSSTKTIALGTKMKECVRHYVDDVDECDGNFAMATGAALLIGGITGVFTAGVGGAAVFTGGMFINTLTHNACLKNAARDYKNCQGYTYAK